MYNVITEVLLLTFSSRDIKGITRTDFANDVTSSSITSLATASVDDAVSRYNSELSRLLDSHAPARTRKAKSHQDSPWYNSDISKAKKQLRRLERKWRNNGKLQIDRESFCAQRNRVNYLVSQAKRSYHTRLIEDCGDDHKKLFNVANRLLNCKQSSPLPKHADSNSMAETFIQFFHSKVKKKSEIVLVLMLYYSNLNLSPLLPWKLFKIPLQMKFFPFFVNCPLNLVHWIQFLPFL